MSPDSLIIIDGNSLAHRAFHAIPLLSTTQGLLTNAVYGFTNMLLKVLAREKPEGIAVAFDKGKITFRHDQFADYKALRKATPDELKPQFPILKDLLRAMRIQIFEIEGFEADDLIGTLVTKAEQAGLKSIIVTGDKDTLQLVSPYTKVLLTKKGISELEEYDEDKVRQRFGITPAQFADFKGLSGDPSDNIPGVPGIGEKTASRLLSRYGTVEEVIAHAGELPGRLGNQIITFGEQAMLSRRLATIQREVPVDIDLDLCCWQGPDYKSLLEILKKLEFKSIIKSIMNDKKLPGDIEKHSEAGTGLQTYPVKYRLLNTQAGLDYFLQAIRKSGCLSIALSGTRSGGITAAGLAINHDAVYYLLPDAGLSLDEVLRVIKHICEDDNITKYCHNGKELIWLLHHHKIKLRNLGFDTMVAAYLLNPASPSQDLGNVLLEHLDVVLPLGGEEELPARADCIMQLVRLLDNKLRLQEEEQLYYEVELPLVEVLAAMEINGVAVDKEQLETMSKELSMQIDALTEEIYRLSGENFNINSPKQLGRVLFEKLKLPAIKKTKTGYSTDAEVLDELAASHEVVSKILEYRQMVKLKTTYTDSLASLINPQTNRLHTTFYQTVTATGRLSSAEPNLQNIPIRLEQGRKIRKVFIPGRAGNLLLAADYSQIELRILAHLSGDPNLTNSFLNREDIHTRTAAEVFGVPLEEVTREMRGRAKAVNFGIIYGLSDYGLARDIKVSRQEARQYIQNYFARYPVVKSYIDRTIREAKEKGYSTTLLNRRRYLPELFSSNHTIRSFGERTAINSPLQGSAADLIKQAMVRIHRKLNGQALQSKMILQVHDELIFDVPAEEIPVMRELVKECMENALPMSVPLEVDLKIGPNWYDVKKV
ncbi:MAG: DNA polymerase I [Peptococcaceae bacterium]|jgi:DNA polymerase-1|nr:MAG: DNA polymerase I [Peptococcaceae bacterium]